MRTAFYELRVGSPEFRVVGKILLCFEAKGAFVAEIINIFLPVNFDCKDL